MTGSWERVPSDFARLCHWPFPSRSNWPRNRISSCTRSVERNRRDKRDEEAAKERDTAYGTLRSSVENEAQKLLPHGKANRQTIDKALGLTERRLAQKLGEENASHEKVVDRLRQSLALQYIKEPSVSVAQIAWLLGYEGPTSFNHAFARWTGRSASEARDENQSRNDGKVSKLGRVP